MSRLKNEPVYTIVEDKLDELQEQVNPAAEKPENKRAVLLKKYRPGTSFITTRFPGYEGCRVVLGVGTANQAGFIRYAVELPDLPASAPTRVHNCPFCHLDFGAA